MAIQISGTTIINNSKQIQNIGGKGGIISGTFTIGGPQGFASIKCSGFRGHVMGMVSFDNAYGTILAALASSRTTSTDDHYVHTIKSDNTQNAYISYNPQAYEHKFNLTNNYYTTKTIYYSFWYSGNTVPTITIT